MIRIFRFAGIALALGLLPQAWAQSCPANLAHLDGKLPRYNMPALEQVRQAVLKQDLNDALSRGRAAGMSPAQVASATLQQAKAAEEEAKRAEQCVRQVSTNADGDLQRLRSGAYQFSNGNSMREACLAQYVNMYYMQVAMKESALGIACLANR